MQKEKYDVVVVGAGPAGGSCARELAQKGHKVLLLEKSLEVGEPNYSTAGTPPETIQDFGIPQDVLFDSWNSLLLQGPHEHVEFRYGRKIGYTMKFRELKQFLVKDAIKHGADTRVNATANKAIIKGGKIVGVGFTSTYGKEEVYSDVVVDATGAPGVLASQLGLRKAMMENYAPAVEFYMSNLHLEKSHRVEIYVGHHFKGGYGWIFPTGKNEAKVGLAWIAKDHPSQENLFVALHRFIQENNHLKGGNVVELHSHFIFVNGGLKRHVMNGFIAIGDAASQVNPLAGEGIRHCLWSGRIAAEVIDRTFKNKGTLHDYEKAWSRYTDHKWGLCAKAWQLVLNLDEASLDSIVKVLRNVDKEDVWEVLFHYKFKLLLKYLRYAPSIIHKETMKEVRQLLLKLV